MPGKVCTEQPAEIRLDRRRVDSTTGTDPAARDAVQPKSGSAAVRTAESHVVVRTRWARLAALPAGTVPVIYLVVGSAAVLLQRVVLQGPPGSPADLREVASELGLVAATAGLILILERRGTRDRTLLRQSEERYRRIAESITDYVYTVRVEAGRPIATEHHAGCQAVTGYTATELAADESLWLTMIAPEDRQAVLEQSECALLGGAPGPLEHRLIRKDGTSSWIKRTIVPALDESGAVVSYDCVIRDITERRTLQEQLRQAHKMEAVGQLAGGIAHDFNNLLTVIRGYADLARSSLHEDGPARADIDEVLVAADRAVELTGQLLAFSRRQVLQPQVLDASAATIRLAPMLRRLLGEHIELDTSHSLSHGRIVVDPGQLEQVIINLAVNARDAMLDGGRLTIETADVALATQDEAAPLGINPGSYVVLTVSDTGLGMDEETRARAFEPFFTTKEPGKGTGMGLATVYGIVKQSHGSVSLSSEPGRGTTFRIYFPGSDQEAIDIDARSHDEPADLLGRETVLLVEDDAVVRRFASRALADHGYLVLEAADGATAMTLAESHTGGIDLLVTDVVMPAMNGHELADRLRAAHLSPIVLYVSGFPEDHLDFEDLTEPGVGFLPKPYSVDELARAIRNLLDRG